VKLREARQGQENGDPNPNPKCSLLFLHIFVSGLLYQGTIISSYDVGSFAESCTGKISIQTLGMVWYPGTTLAWPGWSGVGPWPGSALHPLATVTGRDSGRHRLSF
jgi:hypothetical protein